MNVSAAIMAHASRRERVAALLDYVPGAAVEWDEIGSEWHTARRALLAYDDRAEWHVVIQDDAILPAAFSAALSAVLSPLEPTQPIGLYVGTTRPYDRLVAKVVRRAHDVGSTWVEMRGPWWGVAVVFPTIQIPSIVAACDQERATDFYDVKLTRAYKRAGIWTRYPIPSLVDHADGPTLIGSRPGRRVAHDYIGDRDPASFDWASEPVRVDLRGRIVVPSPA